VRDEGGYEHILFALEDRVATITLDRPERSNAFHFGLGAELEAAYARCDEDDDVRAGVLTGAGKAFCVAGDKVGPRHQHRPTGLARGRALAGHRS
jgi:enoyl-CoA hydratase/carnithine racemase